MTDLSKCTLGKMRVSACGGMCLACGWYEPEIRRRLTLPLRLGADGMWRKCVGVAAREKAGETE